MKTEIKMVGLLLLTLLFACTQKENRVNVIETTERAIKDSVSVDEKKERKKIKIAILLDTSNSMDGLIEQAKNQLWKIVNQLAKATDNKGEDPDIEFALYQYGNDNLSILDGYVEQISPFTSELDEISEKLFALTTTGGSEYCGRVIKTSLQELTWTDNKEDLQLIFIAGNEGFDQGGVNYEKASALANNQHVTVNTIFCGDYNRGIDTFWKHGADLGQGKYMNIDHDAQIVHISSPYDQGISNLNVKLNKTYLPYGSQGRSKKEKQIREDANASSYGEVNAVKRIMSKSSKVYKNATWDLVDASSRSGFDLSEIENESLPDTMRTMSLEEKGAYLFEYIEQRKKVKGEILNLKKKREQFVAKVKLEKAKDGKVQLDDAIISSIVEQAEAKSFQFENNLN
ncbi:MAG: VWA domain-containing protein [Flavobacteriales bacterium]|nr:VWA domain-containing protein [Flavobacteriales bacterium]